MNHRFCFCALLMSFGFSAFAESPLSWDDCVQRARENHPGLVAARKNVEAAEASIRSARSGGLPQLTASGRAAYSDDSKSSGGEDSYQGSIEAQQLLYDGGSARSAVHTAEADRAVALAEARQTEASILYNLRVAYVDVLVGQSQLGLFEQIRSRRADNVEMVELRYLGGQEHQGSLALNQASLKEAELDLEQARRSLETARSALGRAMGLDGEFSGLSVTGRFEDVAVVREVDLQQLTRSTPTYLKSVASLARAEARLQDARSGTRPTVTAYGSASRYGSALDMEEDNLSAGVRVTLPVWEGGRAGADIRQAAAQKAAAEANLEDTLFSQRASLDQALLEERNAGEMVSVQQQFLAAQELRAAIAREQYGNGLLKFDNWDIIENDLISRQKSLLESRRQALRAEAAWWRVCGRGLDESSGDRP